VELGLSAVVERESVVEHALHRLHRRNIPRKRLVEGAGKVEAFIHHAYAAHVPWQRLVERSSAYKQCFQAAHSLHVPRAYRLIEVPRVKEGGSEVLDGTRVPPIEGLVECLGLAKEVCAPRRPRRARSEAWEQDRSAHAAQSVGWHG